MRGTLLASSGTLALLLLALATAGCKPPAAPPPDKTKDAGTRPEPSPTPESRSIIRPAVEPEEEAPAPPPEQIEAVVRFDDRTTTLTDQAREQIDALLQTPTMQAGGPVILRGHSDSRGFDGDNLVSSRHRAESVRDYLEAKGVAAARVTVIALGEGRPVAPNTRLDGSDDPEGRAKNRRVDIEVRLPDPPVVVPVPAPVSVPDPSAAASPANDQR